MLRTFEDAMSEKHGCRVDDVIGCYKKLKPEKGGDIGKTVGAVEERLRKDFGRGRK